MSEFVHLRLHTQYAITDSLIRIAPLFDALSDDQATAVAMTDTMNLFAAIKFFNTAIKNQVKPIFGCDFWFYEGEKRPPSRLTLLAENDAGIHNLYKLISKAYLEGKRPKDIPLCEYDWLSPETVNGLICLSGGIEGRLGRALLAKDEDHVGLTVDQMSTLFAKDSFCIELSRLGHPEESEYIQLACELASRHHLPVLATHCPCFISPKDFTAHDVRVCIQEGYVLTDPKRPQPVKASQYLKTQAEMTSLFEDIPEAIDNTAAIAMRCNVKMSLGETFLPDFPVPEGMTIGDYLRDVSQKGLRDRHQADELSANFEMSVYEDRLEEELGVIISMGFPGYFLIVADFIAWAKENDVPVGPGRGSGAGSLVAYVLGITDIDPLPYDLLFERFLNPERVSMPDFDIDFCMEGRDRVIEYVGNHYGRSCVSQIITYGTMAAKAVVRDVGRVLSQPYGFVDGIAKLIPMDIGMTLTKALDEEEQLRLRYEEEEEVTALIDMALKLEGVVRNVGKHAGGVVIAPSQLSDFCPIYCEAGSSQQVTQFDKDDIEAVGLVKFDFLGLRNLTIIHRTVETVNAELATYNKPPVNITHIPLDDVKTFDLLKRCDTTAIFQLESRGMKDLIQRLQPDCFEDIIALVALFRPGPLQSGMVDDFIDRKHGRAEIEYPHPDIQGVLEPTYGVILYQEQVMQISQILAGYTLGAADLLRRAMGKKKPEEMAKQRQIFLEGSLKRGIEEDTAIGIFDLMEKFAGYGFNKSHSAAYAMVSYQTAWLKAHYPAHFMAAVLSSDMDNTDKVVNFYEDAHHIGVDILPLNINKSAYRFVVEGEAIRYGLGAVKGVGEAAAEHIVEECKTNGPYEHLFDFCQRIESQKAGRRTLEPLIDSGAFDTFEEGRATLHASLDKALASAEQKARNISVGQSDLFSAMPDTHVNQYTKVEEHQLELLRREKAVLGFYMSGHPCEYYRDFFKAMGVQSLRALEGSQKTALVAGFIVAMRRLRTKRGDPMCIVLLDDGTAKRDIMVFSEQLQLFNGVLVQDQLAFFSVDVKPDHYTGGQRLSVKEAWTLAEARADKCKKIKLKVGHHQAQAGALREINSLIEQNPGSTSIEFEYIRPEGSITLRCGPNAQIKLTELCYDRIVELVSETHCEY